MTLRIDTSRALTTHEERAALVRAIVAAQPEDELDWIEWKIAGDLSKGPTRGTIARHTSSGWPTACRTGQRCTRAAAGT